MQQLFRVSLLALITSLAYADTPAFDPESEGVIVIGIGPGEYSFDISQGSIERQRWKRGKRQPVFSGGATQGYIVAVVPANTDLAITQISRVAEGRDPYTWCGLNFIPFFSVPAGHVRYISHFTYTWPAKMQPWFTTAPDLEAARAFLDTNHPGLGGKLEDGGFQTRLTRLECRNVNGPRPP